MKPVQLFILLFAAVTSFSQQFNTVYRTPGDSSRNFYTLVTPGDSISGLLVLNARTLADSSYRQANDLKISVLTIFPTDNYLDNLTSEALLSRIDSMIAEVITQNRIAKNKIIIGGMSVAGTGAVRYTEYCYLNKSKYCIKPIAVFGADPPLDYERLYNQAARTIKRNYNKEAVEESKSLVELLSKKLNGTPKSNITSYQKKSPYCYLAVNGGNAYLLNHLAVRLYTDPDINWWINNRRKDYYDLNSADNAALINQLKLNGNNDAELIVTYQRGVLLGGHPHSWSIVDERELLSWCSDIFSKLK